MFNPMALNERRILVTGASSGIGRETSILLSRLGAQLVLVARDEERLEQTASALEGSGHRIEVFDLTVVDDIVGWLQRVASETGSLSGLVHVAGIQIIRPLRMLNEDIVDRVMRINFNAAVALARGFIRKQVHEPGSSIVLLTSTMGIVGQPGIAAYSASKGAIIALCKSLALELAKDDIRVNCVAPAVVKTEMVDSFHQKLTQEQVASIEAMHPLGFGTPLDVANAIAFLLADTGRWITGTTLVVDGGYTAH